MGEQAGAGAGEGAQGGAAGGPTPWATLTPENRTFVTGKGFRDENSLAQSYRELESFRGVPAERLLKLPDKEDAPEWSDIYGRLGRPAKAEEYGIEGADAELLAKAHEAGLSKRQVQRLADYLGERGKAAAGQSAKADEERAAQQQLELQNLKREWGPEFDANVKHARAVADRVYKAMGYKDAESLNADLTKIEDQIGTEKFMKMFSFLGRGTAEHRFVEGQQDKNGFGETTPAAAMAKFRQLSSDPGFMKRVYDGDHLAKEEWDRWAKLAQSEYRPGGPQ